MRGCYQETWWIYIMKIFHNINIKTFPHTRLNISKGVIRSKELSLATPEEISSALGSQGVSDYWRISIRINDENIFTDTYIFTFNSAKIPSKIKIGYNVKPVELYIPTPLKCFRCQKFGHHRDNCRSRPTCTKCGQVTLIMLKKSARMKLNAQIARKIIQLTLKLVITGKKKKIIEVNYKRNISCTEAKKRSWRVHERHFLCKNSG